MAIDVRPSGKFRAGVRLGSTHGYIGLYDTREDAETAVALEYERIKAGTSVLLDAENFVTYPVFAELVGVPHGTIKRWVSEGLPCQKYGNTARIHAPTGKAWVAKNRAGSVSVDRASVVYVAKRDRDGAIKIGFTSNIGQRERDLRKCGDNVSIRAALPGDKRAELMLHERFASSRIDGEWFMAAENDVVDALKEAVSQ